MPTIKVRIAVAVTAEDDWYAYAISGSPDSDSMDEVVGNVIDGVPLATYFIEADLPLPAPQTIQGYVVVAEGA